MSIRLSWDKDRRIQCLLHLLSKLDVLDRSPSCLFVQGRYKLVTLIQMSLSIQGDMYNL